MQNDWVENLLQSRKREREKCSKNGSAHRYGVRRYIWPRCVRSASGVEVTFVNHFDSTIFLFSINSQDNHKHWKNSREIQLLFLIPFVWKNVGRNTKIWSYFLKYFFCWKITRTEKIHWNKLKTRKLTRKALTLLFETLLRIDSRFSRVH